MADNGRFYVEINVKAGQKGCQNSCFRTHLCPINVVLEPLRRAITVFSGLRLASVFPKTVLKPRMVPGWEVGQDPCLDRVPLDLSDPCSGPLTRVPGGKVIVPRAGE